VPDLYGWIVFVHVAALLIAFLAHGVSAGMALKLGSVRDRATVKALLDMSQQSMLVFAAALLVLVVAGIVLGFMGEFWGRLWLWVSIVLFALVFLAMTPMAAKRMRRLREIVEVEPTPELDAEMAQILSTWRPMPTLGMGIGGLLVITWLMMAKPF
jgi:MFS family permease